MSNEGDSVAVGMRGSDGVTFDSTDTNNNPKISQIESAHVEPKSEVAPAVAQQNNIDFSIYKQFLCLDNFTWAADDAVGKLLWKNIISPSFNNDFVRYLSGMYNTWRGGFDYKIKVAGTGFHGGALILVRIPPNIAPTALTNLSAITAFPYVVIDPKTLEAISHGAMDQANVMYHYISTKHQTTQFIGGFVAVYVMLPLIIANATGAPKVNIQIFTKPSPDFTFGQLIPPSLPSRSFMTDYPTTPDLLGEHEEVFYSITPNVTNSYGTSYNLTDVHGKPVPQQMKGMQNVDCRTADDAYVDSKGAGRCRHNDKKLQMPFAGTLVPAIDVDNSGDKTSVTSVIDKAIDFAKDVVTSDKPTGANNRYYQMKQMFKGKDKTESAATFTNTVPSDTQKGPKVPQKRTIMNVGAIVETGIKRKADPKSGSKAIYSKVKTSQTAAFKDHLKRNPYKRRRRINVLGRRKSSLMERHIPEEMFPIFFDDELGGWWSWLLWVGEIIEAGLAVLAAVVTPSPISAALAAVSIINVIGHYPGNYTIDSSGNIVEVYPMTYTEALAAVEFIPTLARPFHLWRNSNDAQQLMNYLNCIDFYHNPDYLKEFSGMNVYLNLADVVQLYQIPYFYENHYSYLYDSMCDCLDQDHAQITDFHAMMNDMYAKESHNYSNYRVSSDVVELYD